MSSALTTGTVTWERSADIMAFSQSATFCFSWLGMPSYSFTTLSWSATTVKVQVCHVILDLISSFSSFEISISSNSIFRFIFFNFDQCWLNRNLFVDFFWLDPWKSGEESEFVFFKKIIDVAKGILSFRIREIKCFLRQSSQKILVVWHDTNV